MHDIATWSRQSCSRAHRWQLGHNGAQILNLLISNDEPQLATSAKTIFNDSYPF